MSTDPYLGEIRMFAFDYAPDGWVPCNGQPLPMPLAGSLIAVLGYYTNSASTFSTPNLQGRVPMHRGQRNHWGGSGGTETVTLSNDQFPAHQHSIMASVPPGTLNAPGPTSTETGTQERTLARASGGNVYQASDANLVKLNNQTLGLPAAPQPHTNMQPYLTLNFCIALSGTDPL